MPVTDGLPRGWETEQERRATGLSRTRCVLSTSKVAERGRCHDQDFLRYCCVRCCGRLYRCFPDFVPASPCQSADAGRQGRQHQLASGCHDLWPERLAVSRCGLLAQCRRTARSAPRGSAGVRGSVCQFDGPLIRTLRRVLPEFAVPVQAEGAVPPSANFFFVHDPVNDRFDTDRTGATLWRRS